MGDDFDSILLEKIEAEILPLLEQIAEQVVEQAKAKPGEVSAAPLPFIISDDVVYENGEFVFMNFSFGELRSKDQEEIEGELTVAWMTHVMAELGKEGEEYSFSDIVKMITDQIVSD